MSFEDFVKTLPEKQQGWIKKDRIDSEEKFWQVLEDNRAMIGQSIRVPGEDAGDKDWAKFNEELTRKVPSLIHSPDPDNPEAVKDILTKLGMPASETDYGVVELDEKKVSVELVNTIRSLAHKAQLTKGQYEALVKPLVETLTERTDARSMDQRKAMQELQYEWGNTFEHKTALIKALIDKTDAPDQLKLSVSNLTVPVETMKWLDQMVEAYGGEEGLNIIPHKGADDRLTPSVANAKLQDIMNNREHPYWDKTRAGHTQAVERVLQLRLMANPNLSTDINDLRKTSVPV